MESTNRRRVVSTAAATILASLTGCASSGIFEDKGGPGSIDTVTPPEITARDASPGGATTTFRIKWRALAATRIDVNVDDAITSTPYGGGNGEQMFMIVGHSTKNVGDEAHSFDPESFKLDSGEDDGVYPVAALTHLTAFAPRSIEPGSKTTGWVPIVVPRDSQSLELFFDQAGYETPVEVKFEQDSSVPIPI